MIKKIQEREDSCVCVLLFTQNKIGKLEITCKEKGNSAGKLDQIDIHEYLQERQLESQGYVFNVADFSQEVGA